jgi:cell division protein FtsB
MAIRGRHSVLAKLFWQRFGILLLLALILLATLAVLNVYRKERDSRALRGQAEGRLADLQKQERSLSEHINSLRTDRGKEEVLREQYGVGWEGEELVVLVEPVQVAPAPEPAGMRQWVRKFLPFW